MIIIDDEPDLQSFLISKSFPAGVIDINMSECCGVGGGGVIIRNGKKATKLTPINLNRKLPIGADILSVMSKEYGDRILNVRELTPLKLHHPGIVKYLNHRQGIPL